MARPRKKGLDYFPLDVDIFEDDKLFDVQNDYGPLGEIIYIRLLCLVYKHGYFYRFESIDKLAAMMIRSVGNRWAKDKKTVKEVILYLAKINLFSAELMQRNVITSRSIQERYLTAVERRQSKIEEYSLLEDNDFHEGIPTAPENHVSATETEINAAETQVNVSDNATKESKEKHSKLNESKAEESRYFSPQPTPLSAENACLSQENYDALVYDYGKKIVDEYLDKIKNWTARKNISIGECEGMMRKWITQDGIKPIDHSIDKYNCVINQF